jgi:hypothetical protein
MMTPDGHSLDASNSALEQAASAARPWQRAQRKQADPCGPRPGHRPPLLTACVRWNRVPRSLFPLLLLLAVLGCREHRDAATKTEQHRSRSTVVILKVVGIVRDAQSHEPIPGVRVGTLPGQSCLSRQLSTTDRQGRFEVEFGYNPARPSRLEGIDLEKSGYQEVRFFEGDLLKRRVNEKVMLTVDLVAS